MEKKLVKNTSLSFHPISSPSLLYSPNNYTKFEGIVHLRLKNPFNLLFSSSKLYKFQKSRPTLASSKMP